MLFYDGLNLIYVLINNIKKHTSIMSQRETQGYFSICMVKFKFFFCKTLKKGFINILKDFFLCEKI